MRMKVRVEFRFNAPAWAEASDEDVVGSTAAAGPRLNH